MLFEAGLLNVLRTLLIFACIYYGFKLIARFLLPYLLKRFINKQANNFGNNYNTNSRSEGEVNVKQAKSSNKNNKDQLGDYIDYEDVD